MKKIALILVIILGLKVNGSSQNIGNQFTVAVYENSGNLPITAVEANLTYDASKLQYIALDNSGSSFTESFGASGGNGTVQMVRFRKGGEPGVTGNQLVSKVTFKALASATNTPISVAKSSHILGSTSSDELWNGAATTTTITIASGASIAPSASAPTGGTSTAPSSTTSGGSSSNGGRATSQTNTGNTSTPSNATQTNTEQSAENAPTAQLSGAMVAVVVTTADGLPARDVTVTLGQDSVITDFTGVASFTGVPAGAYTVRITRKGVTTTKDIAVTTDTSLQEFKITLQKKSPPLLLFIPLLVVLVIVAILIRKRRSSGTGGSNSTIPPATAQPMSDPLTVSQSSTPYDPNQQ